MAELFRKKALSKLAAPQRLDERVTLIAPRWWMTLLALFVALAIACLWGWFGRIATKVQGSGMLLEMSGFRNIVSSSDGVVAYLNVQEGMTVKEGEIIGVVALPSEQMDLKFYRDKLELIRKEVSDMTLAVDRDKEHRVDFYQKMSSGNEESIAKLSQILDQLTQMSATYTDFSQRGIVTRVESLKMLQDMLNASMNVTRQHQENMRTDIEKADYELSMQREYWQKQEKLMDAEYELKSKMAQYMTRRLMVSPTHGVIVNVQKSAGDPISAGEVVCLLQPSLDDALYVGAFIPAAKSKSVREGQLVYVAPSNLEPQRTGYMLGIVQKVGSYPAAFEQLVNVFKNRDLTQVLKGDDVAVMVEVSLIPDGDNHTGFRWTGKAPEEALISAGSLCTISIAVEQRPPISYVLPWVREKLLGDVRHEIGSEGK